MSSRTQILASRLAERFPQLRALPVVPGDVAVEVTHEQLLEVCRELHDDPQFGFEQLIDLAGVDYLEYGREEWRTYSASNSGFSRGVNRAEVEHETPPGRFAVTYQLLSVSNNWRLRLRCFTTDGEPPILDSVVGIWAGANWFEREAFDMFGILFRGHPDLRRILTDYGFIGHPFRKDFPLIGNVEVKYDEEKGRVVYQPVSIVPRTLVPRVIRADNRYDQQLKEVPVGAADRR